MKKIFAFLAALAMTVSAFGTIVLADENPNPDAVTVLINGVELSSDVPAQIIGDRTMVPMRAIFETLGANVSWIEDKQAIIATKGPTLMAMKIGVNTLSMSTIGGEDKNVTLDVPPQIVNDRTLVPARAISEALGCTVGWDGDTRTVTITN